MLSCVVASGASSSRAVGMRPRSIPHRVSLSLEHLTTWWLVLPASKQECKREGQHVWSQDGSHGHWGLSQDVISHCLCCRLLSEASPSAQGEGYRDVSSSSGVTGGLSEGLTLSEPSSCDRRAEPATCIILILCHPHGGLSFSSRPRWGQLTSQRVAQLGQEPRSADPKAFPALLTVFACLLCAWPPQPLPPCSSSSFPCGHQPESSPFHEGGCAVGTPHAGLP